MVNPFRLGRSWLVATVVLTACSPMRQSSMAGGERVTMEQVSLVHFGDRLGKHFHPCTPVSGTPRETTVRIGPTGGVVKLSDSGSGPAHMLLVHPNAKLDHEFRMAELPGSRAGVNITSEPQLLKGNGILKAILIIDGRQCGSLPSKFGVGKDVGGQPEMKPSIWDQNARITWGHLTDLSAYAIGVP